jgi:CBS domain-containing protein
MTLESISRREVVAIDEHATVQQAARRMRDRHVGALVVTRGDAETSQLVGIVTDRDLALQVLAAGGSPQAPVGPLASTAIAAVPHTSDLADAARAMRDAGVRRLLLVDPEWQVHGIVTLDDLIGAYADQIDDLASALDRGLQHEVAVGEGASMPPVSVRVPESLASAWRRTVAP